MAGSLMITEKWIREKLNLQIDNLDTVRSLSLPGSYHVKITHLGRSLLSFTRLKHLDLSRNSLESLEGLDHLRSLESLNIYYNKIPDLKEIFRLRHNTKLTELDIRLNPVTQSEPDYRLFIVHMLLDLHVLDDRKVSDEERKAALLFFDTDQAYELDKSICKENVTPNKRSTPVNNHSTVQSRVTLTKAIAPLRRGLGADTEELLELFAERGDHLFINSSPPSRSVKRKVLANRITSPSHSKNKKTTEKRIVTPIKSPSNNKTTQTAGLHFTPNPHRHGDTVAIDTVTMATNNKKEDNERLQVTSRPAESNLPNELKDNNMVTQPQAHKEQFSNDQQILQQQSITTLLSNLTDRQKEIEKTLSQLTDSLSQILTHSSQLQSVVVMLQESHKSLISSNQQLLHELNEIKYRHSQEVSQLNANYETLRSLVHNKLHL